MLHTNRGDVTGRHLAQFGMTKSGTGRRAFIVEEKNDVVEINNLNWGLFERRAGRHVDGFNKRKVLRAKTFAHCMQLCMSQMNGPKNDSTFSKK